MGIGEAANFIAYAFAPASVVTPLGALSIVITAILSSRYLYENLNVLGKLGCFLCILGSTVIVLHAPKAEEVDNLDELIIKLQNPIFLIYVFIVIALCLYIVFYCGPAYGHENVSIYIILCSTIGSLTVMSCKGLGLAIRDTLYGETNQMSNWLTWAFLFSIIFCIMVQMNYLNKALDLFNTGIVTPIYYVFFTTFVIIASSILFEEWKQMNAQDIVGSICGFLIVITAIFLLNAFKDVNISYNDLKHLSVPKKEALRKRIDEHYEDEVLEIGQERNYGSPSVARNT